METSNNDTEKLTSENKVENEPLGNVDEKISDFIVSDENDTKSNEKPDCNINKDANDKVDEKPVLEEIETEKPADELPGDVSDEKDTKSNEKPDCNINKDVNDKVEKPVQIETEKQVDELPVDVDENVNKLGGAGENENCSEANEINEETDDKQDTSYDPKDVHYEGDIAVYTDPSSKFQYRWDKEKEEWVPKNDVTYGFEDDTHTYVDGDGITFFWDKQKNAWFPKINDDFMAQYQMNYGFIDNTTPEKEKEVPAPIVEKTNEQKGVKRKPTDPTWFELDEQHNTKVYVSNLPTDTTQTEFVDLMQKCGLVMRDPFTQNMKIKLYKEPGTDNLKGDALCTYIRIESVELALKLLDGMMFKGQKIKVERARFEMRGNYDPKLKPKSKKRKEKQKVQKMQEMLFDWRPEKLRGERAKHEKVVVVKNVFDPDVFDEDVGLILEYQQDLREECSKCGEVRKVIVYDRHPEGVVQVNMKEPEQADECVKLLNGRWFGKRKLSAEIWDGKTKFKIAETDSEITQRRQKWDKFLEGENEKKEPKELPTEQKSIVNSETQM